LTKKSKLFSQFRINIGETKFCYHYFDKSFNFNDKNLNRNLDAQYNRYDFEKVDQVENDKTKIYYYNFDNFNNIKEF